MFNPFNCLDLHSYPLKHRLIKNTNNTICNLEIVPHEIPNICYVQLQLIRLGTKEYLFISSASVLMFPLIIYFF